MINDDLHKATFMLALAGVPMPTIEKDELRKFHIEALYSGGKYDGVNRCFNNLSEAIDFMLSNRANISVGRGHVAEVKIGELRPFELFNGVSIW